MAQEDLNGPYGLALNEAFLLGVILDPTTRSVRVGFDCLSLRGDARGQQGRRRVTFEFSPVGRLAASLRNARWDDGDAEAVPIQPSDLLTTVREMGCLPIHGWEFFDLPEADWAGFRDRMSFDWHDGVDGLSHSMRLFQDATNRYLEIWLWFDSFTMLDEPEKTPVDPAEFVASAKRWWTGLRAGDERTKGFGIVPGGPPTSGSG